MGVHDAPQWLLSAFVRSAVGAGATAPTEQIRDAGQALVDRWGSPGRSFHNLKHLVDVLIRVDELVEETHQPDIVRLAAWYHGAIFDAADRKAYANRGGEDEIASARLAFDELDRPRRPRDPRPARARPRRRPRPARPEPVGLRLRGAVRRRPRDARHRAAEVQVVRAGHPHRVLAPAGRGLPARPRPHPAQAPGAPVAVRQPARVRLGGARAAEPVGRAAAAGEGAARRSTPPPRPPQPRPPSRATAAEGSNAART